MLHLLVQLQLKYLHISSPFKRYVPHSTTTTTTTSRLSGEGAYHWTGPGRCLLRPLTQFYNEKSANFKKENRHSAVFAWVWVFFLPLLVNSPSGDLAGVCVCG